MQALSRALVLAGMPMVVPKHLAAALLGFESAQGVTRQGLTRESAEQAITARALDQYYHLEEDCLVKKADVSKLLLRIQVCTPVFPPASLSDPAQPGLLLTHADRHHQELSPSCNALTALHAVKIELQRLSPSTGVAACSRKLTATVSHSVSQMGHLAITIINCAGRQGHAVRQAACGAGVPADL